MYLLTLTNDSYSDDIRTRGPFESLPTREDIIKEFGSIDAGDHDTQTYTVIDSSKGYEVGSITVNDYDGEIAWGCLS
jgi:hypothetical protein